MGDRLARLVAKLPPHQGVQFGLFGGPYADRQPFASENEFFAANPHVGGMAAEDNRVAMNPFSPLGWAGRDAVRQNELARLLMRNDPQFKPDFSLTPEQTNFLDSNSYSTAQPDDRRETIAARHYSGDPSGGAITTEQQKFTDDMALYFRVRGAPFSAGGF
jgi:hypothetical protein